MAIFLEIIKGPRQVSWGKMEVNFFIEKKEGEYCRVLSYKNTPANRVCDIGSLTSFKSIPASMIQLYSLIYGHSICTQRLRRSVAGACATVWDVL